MSTGERLSIIVPVYNESGTVRAVIDRLLAIALPIPREILVVDDGSTDGTREVLARVVADQEQQSWGPPLGGLAVTVIHIERNGGKGSAVRRGLEHAGGTIVAIQDADLELDPAQLGRLVDPILRGETAVVYGSRFLDGRADAPWLTVFANRALTMVTNLLFGASITDMETCYKIMRIEVARSLELTANRFDIEPEITARLLRRGHRIAEIPVRFDARSRAEGKKIGWRDGLCAIQVLLRERFRAQSGGSTQQDPPYDAPVRQAPPHRVDSEAASDVGAVPDVGAAFPPSSRLRRGWPERLRREGRRRPDAD